MKTLRLTEKDFKETDYYWKEYCGKEDVSDFDGNIEIEGNLSYVRFDSMKVSGHIWAEAGTSIKAGDGIEAGTSIKAGLSISCKLVLKFSYRLFAGVAVWRNKYNEEKKITCGRLEGGEVCYGDVEELGLPEEKDQDVENAIKLLEEKGLLKDGKILSK